MAHVELSLTEAFVPEFASNVDRWTATVAAASEPCMVIDPDATILAVSASCCELLGMDEPTSVVGRVLLDGVLRLIDFTAARGQLGDLETEKIPPLLALSSERLARGLMRVELDGGTATDVTVDAIATPLLDGGVAVASLTFFSGV